MEEAKSAQQAALQLLQSINEASNDIRYRVLESWTVAHTGEKQNLEQATDSLTQILADHVRMRDLPSTRVSYVRWRSLFLALEQQRGRDLCDQRVSNRIEERSEGSAVPQRDAEDRLEYGRSG